MRRVGYGDVRGYVTLIAALAALGWRVTAICPSGDRDGPEWTVTIKRVDFVASMTAIAPDPDRALEELLRYTAADAEDAG